MRFKRLVVFIRSRYEKVNLAQIVQDQMLLYIPSKMSQNKVLTSKEDGKIRINTAAKEQLEKLQGLALERQKVF